MSDIDTVREYMEIHAGTELNADAVLEGLAWSKKKRESIKTYLNRLVKKSILNRALPGFFVFPPSKVRKPTLGAELHRETVELHNIHLISPPVTTLEGSPPPEQINNIVTDTRDKVRSMFHQTNVEIWEHIGNKDVYNGVWNGRPLKISRSSTIEIRLKATDKPLDEWEMYGFEEYLCGWFSPIDFKSISWRIPFIELNIDLHRVTMTPTMITLQDYEGVWQRAYQKGDTLRRENRISINTTLDEVIKNLRGDAQIGVVGLHDKIDILVEAIRELNKQYNRQEAWIEKLIEKNIEEKELYVKFGGR